LLAVEVEVEVAATDVADPEDPSSLQPAIKKRLKTAGITLGVSCGSLVDVTNGSPLA
jgi:hypothetical protein